MRIRQPYTLSLRSARLNNKSQTNDTEQYSCIYMHMNLPFSHVKLGRPQLADLRNPYIYAQISIIQHFL